MATKAYQAMHEALVKRPIYFWSNGKIEGIKVRIRCADHVEPGEPGKKLTARQVWNDIYRCDVCRWGGGR
ncbi:MAG: hypothetical protein UY96_C0003G0080 [Parcubacteria group bacterium GW2011_GWB1_56_8]|nr:MAG: hypothetical protein UY96_C0003G0080 [Parcubacteria group bacterium GW2011_GWB1_56_8]